MKNHTSGENKNVSTLDKKKNILIPKLAKFKAQVKSALKIMINVAALLFFVSLVAGHEKTIYIFYQAKGQLNMLFNTVTFDEYRAKYELSENEKKNLALIEEIKRYSVDSLAYKPTKNFTTIYHQGNSPLLWVISASEKYRIKGYYWNFPIVGDVSYKGFFEEEKAKHEKNRLICLGYDVDMRTVSAWSTLGWFSDPVLSSMLRRSKANLCDLIFHELFHATYYAKSSVDYNENLASFIAKKATIKYLANDTLELNEYLRNHDDNLQIQEFMSARVQTFGAFYDSISGFSEGQKCILKAKKIYQLCRELDHLKVSRQKKIKGLQNNIRDFKNAWFIDFEQYNGLQDSLEGVFNKFYEGNLRRMVQSLK